MAESEIRIQNARSHNLQGVSCRVPLGSLTVVTGVSGSGKSTLAFDTLYAEGQRRYVTSLSTYARQFLERLPRPDVDAISHLPPAIAIEQRNRVTGARSTVGTATEVLDHLRLLFAKAGETRCPDCDRPVELGSVQAVAEAMGARYAGRRLTVTAPLLPRKGPSGKAETPRELRERLVRDGFTRFLDETGELVEVSETPLKSLSKLRRSAELVIDRLAVAPDPEESRSRLAEAVASAFARGEGRLGVLDDAGERASYREGFACQSCSRVFPTPTPALFSFNSPVGACERCQGFGRTAGLDLERVVPDPGKSLKEGAIAPFATPMGRRMQRDLLRACRREGVPPESAWQELSPEQRAFVMDGDAEDAGGDWYGVRGFFEWLEGRRYKVQARVLIARYRRFDPCPDCRGCRLRPEALCVRVGARHLGELSRWTLSELQTWLEELDLPTGAAARAERVLPLLRQRVDTMLRVGLDYLSLDRQLRSLSGGEAQRIQLGTALGGSLTAALYVLDEPSIGLHAQDVDRMLEVLRRIRDGGNTVVVVEHAPEIVAAADHVIDLGPRAGRAGGQLVFEGSVAELRLHPSSLTAASLRGELERPRRARASRGSAGRLRVLGASANNLQELDVEIPLGRLVAVTGVSGAGKSTLVRSVLVGQLTRDPERGECRGIEGAERVREVVVVDQTPAARSPRSNPATVSKSFDGIRKLFAGTRQAKSLGVGPGWFSFNVPGGRCDTCEGSGEVVIDMHFLDDVRVPCDTCGGLRYRREVLEVKLGGRSIVDVLKLSIDDALEVFSQERAIADRLAPLSRVGLGYVSLGQPLSTLSGGENQRLRLALALAAGGEGRLYVLDEPTTGLHPYDIQLLLGCLDELIESGGSVIVVEHNLDVIRAADHVLDLGPGGGPSGGRLLASGTPEAVSKVSGSATAAALRSGFPA